MIWTPATLLAEIALAGRDGISLRRLDEMDAENEVRTLVTLGLVTIANSVCVASTEKGRYLLRHNYRDGGFRRRAA